VPESRRTSSLKKGTHSTMPSRRSTVGLLITARCPVGCSHCILQAGGLHWGEPTPASYRRWVRSIAESGVIRNIGLTGGEPFAVYDTLLDIVPLIRSYGLHPNVLTSAYWATSDAQTEKLLRPLAQAGLEGLGISVDEFHQAKVPIQNVLRALRTAKRLGLWVGVAFCYFDQGRDPATEAEAARAELRDVLGEEAFAQVDVINLNPIQKAGRAQQGVEFPTPSSKVQRKSTRVCTALTPSIWPDGSFACCCGPRLSKTSPLVLGNLNHDPFAELYQRYRKHPILPFLHVWGLTKMVEELRANGLGEDLEGYDAPHEICRLCQKMLINERYAAFFVERFEEPVLRRQLGVERFLLYGDPEPLLSTRRVR